MRLFVLIVSIFLLVGCQKDDSQSSDNTQLEQTDDTGIEQEENTTEQVTLPETNSGSYRLKYGYYGDNVYLDDYELTASSWRLYSYKDGEELPTTYLKHIFSSNGIYESYTASDSTTATMLYKSGYYGVSADKQTLVVNVYEDFSLGRFMTYNYSIYDNLNNDCFAVFNNAKGYENGELVESVLDETNYILCYGN